MERELKLLLAGQRAWETVCRLGAPAGAVFQDNRFYDTRRRVLGRSGWALRLRRQWCGPAASGPPCQWLVALKGPATRQGAAFTRPEHEQEIPARVAWALLEGQARLDETLPEHWFLPEDVARASLADLELVAWFQNVRVRRRIRLAGEELLLEADATTFPGGWKRYEVELEFPESTDPHGLHSELEALLRSHGVEVSEANQGKFAEALRILEVFGMREVPEHGCVLTFEPLAKARVWGGFLLQERYGKPPAPNGQPCGETWEIVDLPGDQSRVREGPLAGATLGDLRRDHMDWLMGRANLLEGRFPLLLKLIHAARTLSVQVHPDAEAAAKLGGRPKTECWVILDSEPGACLYLGLKPGVTREELARACEGPSLEHLLNRVEVHPGDVVFIPAGTVHAIGAGLVLAELQQASDTTYRLHDWGRVGLDGKPRPLHVAEALESIHFQVSGPPPWRPRRGLGRLIEDEAFILELQELAPGASHTWQHRSPLVFLSLEGTATVSAGEDERQLGPGQCCLVPAAAGHTLVSCAQDAVQPARILAGWPPERI